MNKDLVISPGDMIAYGMYLPDDEPEFRRLMKIFTSYAWGKYENVDEFVGHRVSVSGALVHPITLDTEQMVIDEMTGEQVRGIEKERTVLRVYAVDGQPVTKNLYIGFVSDTVARGFKKFISRYGPGDWSVDPVDFVFERVKTPKGFTYSITMV